MGYMQGKYTREYFLKEDADGNPTAFGAEGWDLYQHENGRPRDWNRALLDQIDFAGKTVLDIGCGRGEATKYAKEQGAARVIGLDFSPAACDLARELHQRNGLEIELICDDLAAFTSNLDEHVGPHTTFDIVVMLNVVEHIPRTELTQSMSTLVARLHDKSVVLLNTSVFPVDNDVLAEGLKEEARDSSDQSEETFGMHCNRFTRESLQTYLEGFGLQTIESSAHFYVCPSAPLSAEARSWTALAAAGYPVVPHADYEDQYEHSHTVDAGTPKTDNRYTPSWQRIHGGRLDGREIYVANDLQWQRDILAGTHDKFLFDCAERMDLDGHVVLDVGGHIGYHALRFADLVGETGKVYSFEPNAANRKRMQANFDRNRDLGDRIEILDFAIGAEEGVAEFVFSESIDSGQSSGSFLAGVDTPAPTADYQKLRFQHTLTRVATLDDLQRSGAFEAAPTVVKIDVEGAELSVLEGALACIRACHPTFFVELHSPIAVMQVFRLLHSAGYEITFLDDTAENNACVRAQYAPEQFATIDGVRRMSALAIDTLVNRATRAIRELRISHENEQRLQRLADANLVKAEVDRVSALLDAHGAAPGDLPAESDKEAIAALQCEIDRAGRALADGKAREHAVRVEYQDYVDRRFENRLRRLAKKLIGRHQADPGS